MSSVVVKHVITANSVTQRADHMLGIPNAGCYRISHPIPAITFLILISQKERNKLEEHIYI